MGLIHDDVFDAALNYISDNATEAEIQNASGTALVDGITLTAGNFTGPSDNTAGGGGRSLTCLTSDASDMKAIDVDSAGSATRVVLKTASAVEIIQASFTSAPVSLGASDQVNLSTFDVILQDPS